jgi:RNA polymerase sigma-70 factor (ECF subfamily)
VVEDDESTESDFDELAQTRERADRRLLRKLAAATEPSREDPAAARDARAKLIASYDGYVERVVRLRVFDENEREDVAQAVRLRLARTLLHRSNFDVPFFAVVRRSLRNELIDYFRRHDRRREHATDELPVSGAEPPSDPGEQLDVLGDRRLRDALAQLSQPDRDLLGAKVLLGLSGPEMASRFGMSESNVNVRLHRALAKLRAILSSDVSEQGGRAE